MKVSTFDDTNAGAVTGSAAAPNTILRWAGDIFAAMRAATADRAMRRQLAELDNALLRDIGISEEEIHRVRAMERFTPRAWA